MKLVERRLAGTFEVSSPRHRDSRGYFQRWYDRESFMRAGLPTEWVQGNESGSARSVVRGLHFQRPPHAETKLVRAVSGTVFDVFVDLRRDSPTYGEWDGVELSAESGNLILIPKGFAHGFCVVSDTAVVSYVVDTPHAPQAEGGLAWDDPALAISWPLRGPPILSDRDRAWPRLADLEPLG